MKYLLVFLTLITGYAHKKDSFKNSIWICKVSDRATDTLRFKSNQLVDNYDCEVKYTFHGSYSVREDTLLITEKDDSHSEDGGKPSYYREFFGIKRNFLYPMVKEELIGNKWMRSKVQMSGSLIFKKIK